MLSLLLALLLVLVAGPAAAITVSSTFDGSEPVLSEGGTWATVSGFNPLQKTSGVVGWSNADDSASYWTGPALTATQRCSLVVAGAGNIGGPTARNDGTRFYAFHAGQGGSTLRKWTSAASSSILTTFSATVNAGDTVALEATGTSPVTLTAKVNGVTVATIQDSSTPFTTGQCGILIQSDVRTFTSFTGEDIPPPPTQHVNLRWTNTWTSPAATGNEIWVCPGAGCNPANGTLVGTAGPSDTTFADPASPMPIAGYGVRAIAPASAFSSTWYSAASGGTVPGVATNLQVVQP